MYKSITIVSVLFSSGQDSQVVMLLGWSTYQVLLYRALFDVLALFANSEYFKMNLIT